MLQRRGDYRENDTLEFGYRNKEGSEMLKIVKENKSRSMSDIDKDYPSSMYILIDAYNDEKEGIKGKLYAISRDESSYDELCDLHAKLLNENVASTLTGDYDGLIDIDL